MRYRPATIDDARMLFDWRNDQLTREMSRNSDPVDWSSHQGWISARLARPNPMLFIVEQAGKPVGTFRVDGEEVSYTVAPDMRRRGIGTSMLMLVSDNFGALKAEIFRRNEASIRAATAAGLEVILID